MAGGLSKSSILKKTVQVAFTTVSSKFLGLLREILAVRFLGAGLISDAFWIAFEIPNVLRQAFAEGALNAAFVPAIIKMGKNNQEEQINKLITLSFFIIESLVLLICFYIYFNSEQIILLVAPGFASNPYQLMTAISLNRILIFFIFFISSSSLLIGALQSKNQFFIPSLGPVFLNIFFITGFYLGLKFNLSVYFLAYIILFGGLVQLLLNLFAYLKLGFRFSFPNLETLSCFKHIMFKFIPCILTMSILQINFLIDKRFASYLEPGSISTLKYASGFLRIPLGAFGVAFSTILLSHFSRVFTFAPKRLSYYLLESAKLIFWLTIPSALLMSFFSYKIFYTTLLSAKFNAQDVLRASRFLIIFLSGLSFFALNKVILSIYYSLQSIVLPTIITAIAVLVNIVLNLMLYPFLGAEGIIIATVLSAVIQTILLVLVLNKYFKYRIYLSRFTSFLSKSFIQLLALFSSFYLIYKLIELLIIKSSPNLYDFFINGIGYWLWIGPLTGLFFITMYFTRKLFGIKIHFID